MPKKLYKLNLLDSKPVFSTYVAVVNNCHLLSEIMDFDLIREEQMGNRAVFGKAVLNRLKILKEAGFVSVIRAYKKDASIINRHLRYYFVDKENENAFWSLFDDWLAKQGAVLNIGKNKRYQIYQRYFTDIFKLSCSKATNLIEIMVSDNSKEKKRFDLEYHDNYSPWLGLGAPQSFAEHFRQLVPYYRDYIKTI